jgi:hypothetical protein
MGGEKRVPKGRMSIHVLVYAVFVLLYMLIGIQSWLTLILRSLVL